MSSESPQFDLDFRPTILTPWLRRRQQESYRGGAASDREG
jgi:hypothetical protein